jgi:uncharacterized surface protein with fasciclin (FAS1) repeats
MVGLNKMFAVIALAAIVLAFTAPALAQGMPMASPTMKPTMTPTMAPGTQGGMMQSAQMTTSNKDMMSTMQGMSDISKATSVMKASGMDSMMPGKQHTMFAPSDTAIRQMGTDKMNLLTKDRQMAMNVMKDLTMDSTVMPSDMTDGKTLTTMDGHTMKVSMANGQMMIDGARVTKAVHTNDGMIYVLDGIPSSMMSMMQTVASQMNNAPI